MKKEEGRMRREEERRRKKKEGEGGSRAVEGGRGGEVSQESPKKSVKIGEIRSINRHEQGAHENERALAHRAPPVRS